MKKKSKLLTLIVSILMLSLVIPATVPIVGTVENVSAAVKISNKTATLIVGQTKQLKISGTKIKPKWSSSKKAIASINSAGKVTARKKGTAIITAKIGRKMYKCKVLVKNKLSVAQAKKALTKYLSKKKINFYYNSISKSGNNYVLWVSYTGPGMKAKYLISPSTGKAYEYAPYFGIDLPAVSNIKPEYKFNAYNYQ